MMEVLQPKLESSSFEMDKETFGEMKSTVIKLINSEEKGISVKVSEKGLFIQHDDKDVEPGFCVANEIGSTFEMDKKTFEEMKSTLFKVTKKGFFTQQDDKDIDNDLTNEPGEPGTPLAATNVAPKGQEVPTAMEATPATVSVECQDPFKCNKCPRTFVDIADYNNHVDLHNRMREARYVCEKCNKKCRNFDRLTLHLVSCNELNRRRHHTCSQCRKTYNTKRALNKHKRARHMVRNNRVGPVSNPRFHPRLITYLIPDDGDDVLIMPNRFPEAHSRTNAANENRSQSGNAGTSNTGTRNAGTRNEGSRNAETPTETSNAEINEIVNVDIENMGSVIAGTDNVEIANAGTAKAGNANTGVVDAGTTNAETANEETAAGNGTLMCIL